MASFAVIAENDESQWYHRTGVVYHFRSRYAKFPPPGTHVVYYKGRLKEPKYADARLAAQPHYFARAVIGDTFPDPKSTKGDLFARIEQYQPFAAAVLAKQADGYLEPIPPNRVRTTGATASDRSPTSPLT